MFENIDANIRKLLEGAQYVKYHEHRRRSLRERDVRLPVRGLSEMVPSARRAEPEANKGVALRLDEWVKMRNIVETIDDNLASAIPCYLQEDHQNQMGR